MVERAKIKEGDALGASDPEDLATESRSGVEALLIGHALACPATEPTGDGLDVASEDPCLRFKAQYEMLPDGNKPENHQWEQAQKILSESPDALKRVLEELHNAHLYAVLPDGSLEFMDEPENPPVLVKLADGTIMVFKRAPEEMAVASRMIEAGQAQWANIGEMLKWAEAKKFGVFEADEGDADEGDKDGFSKLMKLAEAANSGLFVGKHGENEVGTVLRDNWLAVFSSTADKVSVFQTISEYRDESIGLLRRITI